MSDRVLDFDQLSPKQKAALSRALLRMAAEESGLAPAEPDLSGATQFYATQGGVDNLHIYRKEGELLVHKDGSKYEGHNRSDGHAGFSKCPVTGQSLGHMPVAYNGIVIESFEDAEGLLRGDGAVLQKYAAKQEVA